jgi:hypothetical protein
MLIRLIYNACATITSMSKRLLLIQLILLFQPYPIGPKLVNISQKLCKSTGAENTNTKEPFFLERLIRIIFASLPFISAKLRHFPPIIPAPHSQDQSYRPHRCRYDISRAFSFRIDLTKLADGFLARRFGADGFQR